MGKITSLKILRVIAVFLLVGCVTASGRIIYVDADATGANDGSSWANAYNFLENALAYARSDANVTEIKVAEGIYKPDQDTTHPEGTGDREATFQLINGVAIRGGYAGYDWPEPNAQDIELYETVLSGDLAGNDGPNFANNGENSYHVVTIGEGASRIFLEGVTVTAGNANGALEEHYSGGGIYCGDGASLVLNKCKLNANSASFKGGGIYGGRSASLVLNKCKLNANSASKGGGIFCAYRSSPILSNCKFSGNSTGRHGFGGGMHCDQSTSPILTNCRFDGNSAGERGGGLYCIMNSPRVTNCLFSKNFAGYEGGGMLSGYECRSTVANCTFSNNSAGFRGGGILNYDNSETKITNCIFWGNRDYYGIDESAQICDNDVYIVNYSCIQGLTGNLGGVGNIDDDPLLSFDGYHLLPDSPCIDAGDPYYEAGVGESDIDAEARVFDDRIDIGADEFVPEAPFIRVSRKQFEFHAYQGGSNPKIQYLYVQNIGPNTLNWEAVEDSSWLELVPASGESSGQLNEITLCVDVSGLDQGLYNCELTITPDGAVNSPQKVRVALYIHVISRVPSQHETIQAAISSAEDWTTIIVADGTYTGQGNRDIDFLGKAITVRSENGPNTCIIDCNGTKDDPHRGFDFLNNEGDNSILDGFTVRNGYASGEWPDDCGGGIRCYQSSPVVMNCVITGNSADSDGGGICCEYSEGPTIQNCLVSGNNAKYGGGICCWHSSPRISKCTISGNNGKYGAGVYCGKDNTTIEMCAISGNTYAGGYNPCQVHGGGGIFSYDSRMSVNNCVINENSTNGFGGGILFEGGRQMITNCTITRNSAGKSTGGCFRLDGGAIAGWFGGHITAYNCILWENHAFHEIFLWTITSVSTATVSYSNIQGGWSGTGNIRTNPLFIDPTNSDYHLLPNSPCIDAGTDGGIYTDIEGNIRPYDFPGADNNGELPEFDMGAYEAVLPPLKVQMKFTPQALNCASRGKWVKAHLALPETYEINDVDTNRPAKIVRPFALESEYMNVFINQAALVEIEAAFSRSDFCGFGPIGGDVIVVGSLRDGQYFYGQDRIKIVTKKLKYLANLASYWLVADCCKPDWCSGLDRDQDGTVNFADFALFDPSPIEVTGD